MQKLEDQVSEISQLNRKDCPLQVCIKKCNSEFRDRENGNLSHLLRQLIYPTSRKANLYQNAVTPNIELFSKG